MSCIARHRAAEAVQATPIRWLPRDKEEEGDLPSKPATKPKERARGHTLYAFYKTLEEKPWKDLAEKCLAMGLSDKGDNAQLVKRIKEAARVMSEDTLFFHAS